MKKFRTLFSATAVCMLFLGLSANAQSGNFVGKWINDPSKDHINEHTSGLVIIGDHTSTWNVFQNRMFLDFNNKLEGDTLALVYKSCDCTTTYVNSSIKFPKAGTVVAKCYLKPGSGLGVIYTDQRFIKSVYDYAKGSNTYRKMIFPEVLHPVTK